MAEEQEASPSPVERIVGKDLDEQAGLGKPLTRRARQIERTVEGYLRANSPPRWMDRLAEIDRGIEREEQRLAEAHAAITTGGGEDAAERWRAIVAGWRFDEELNHLIRTHNEWYPIERQLPIDFRTGEYVKVHGRSHRRRVLDAAWALDRFPVEG